MNLTPVVKQSLDACRVKNWDVYRNHYRQGHFSFVELQLFNELVYSLCKDIPRFHQTQILEAIGEVLSMSFLEFIELGCGKGVLAQLALERYPLIRSWRGYDINPLMKQENLCKHPCYSLNILDRDFWELEDGFVSPAKQALVSSHTLEHFTAQEVEWIFDMGFRAVVVEVPLHNKNYFWKGGGSTHVLDDGWGWFKQMTRDFGYNMVYQHEAPRNKIGAFVKAE